jgi:hypothetical protein
MSDTGSRDHRDWLLNSSNTVPSYERPVTMANLREQIDEVIQRIEHDSSRLDFKLRTERDVRATGIRKLEQRYRLALVYGIFGTGCSVAGLLVAAVALAR